MTEMTFAKIKGKVATLAAIALLFCGNALGVGDTPIGGLRLTSPANGGWYAFTNLGSVVSSNVVATNITVVGTLTLGGSTLTNWPTSAAWGLITGNITNQTDLWGYLSWVQSNTNNMTVNGGFQTTNSPHTANYLQNYQSVTGLIATLAPVPANVAFTTSNNTFSAGTTQSMAMATVTNNATTGTQVVNYQTVTNLLANSNNWNNAWAWVTGNSGDVAYVFSRTNRWNASLTNETDPAFVAWINGVNIAVGSNSVAYSFGTAIGQEAEVSTGSALGYKAKTATGVAIGYHSDSKGDKNIAIGYIATAEGPLTNFTDTVEIGNGMATSNGWFHYRGYPVIDGSGLIHTFSISGLGTASTNNTGDFLAASTQYYPSNNPAGYISSVPVPVSSASNATSATYLTGGQSNTIATAIQPGIKVGASTNADYASTANNASNFVGSTLVVTGGVDKAYAPIIKAYGNVDTVADIHNGHWIAIDGVTNSQKGFVLADNGVPQFKWQLFNNEGGEYAYLRNDRAQKCSLTVSQSGRIGINKVVDVMAYHSIFSGSGNNDMSVGGTYAGRINRVYQVIIVATGAPDTFQYAVSTDGSTFTTNATVYNCATTNQTLERGITVSFSAAIGHAVASTWRFVGFTQLPQGSLTVNPDSPSEILVQTNTSVAAWRDLTYSLSSADLGVVRTLFPNGTLSAVLVGDYIKRNSLYINLATAGSGVTLVPEYWNGSSWVTITVASNYLVDGTANLSQDGLIVWDKSTMGDWTTNNITISDYTNKYYWIRLRTSTPPATIPLATTVGVNGQYRLAVYSAAFDLMPAFHVDGDGNTYANKGFRINTNGTFSSQEWITEARAQKLLTSAFGVYYYPLTNKFLATTNLSMQAVSPAPYTFAITNAFLGNRTNTFGPIFVVTNQIGASTVVAGTKFTLNDYTTLSGQGGVLGTERFQLLEWNTTVTNVLDTSSDSAVFPNNASTYNNINLTITAPVAGYTVNATNYFAFRKQIVETANKTGTLISYCGGQYDNNFIIGATPTGISGSGATNLTYNGKSATYAPATQMLAIPDTLITNNGSATLTLTAGANINAGGYSLTNVSSITFTNGNLLQMLNIGGTQALQSVVAGTNWNILFTTNSL